MTMEKLDEDKSAADMPAWMIVDYITRQFKSAGSPITANLAEYLIRSVMDCPDGFFHATPGAFRKENLPSLINACSEKLKNQPLAVAAAELQIFLDSELPTRESFLASLKLEQNAAHRMLLDDILSSVVNTTWDLDQLNKKVIAYIVRRSGLGDVMDVNVLKDCAAALSSVWPEGTLNKFASMPIERKRTELQDYLLLSSGVRLFNKEKQQGGIGIDNVPSALLASLEKVQTGCVAELERVHMERSALTELLTGVMRGVLPEYIEMEEILKDALIFLHQYIANLDVVKNEITESCAVTNRSLVSFQKRVNDLQDNCRNERVIAANVVFPLFVSLAKDWTMLQGESKRIAFLGQILTQTQLKLAEWEKLRETIKNFTEKLNVVPKLSTEPIFENHIQNPAIRLLHQERTTQYDQIPVALKGCCIVTMVEDSGFLATGNKDIGILQYGDYYLCFRTADAAKRFCMEPVRYFNEINDCITKRLVLKKLLGLRVTKNSSNETEKLVRRSHCAVVKVDAGVQPDLHFVPYHWDPNYDWNVWNIRRKAYQLYNITQSVTHSTQTYYSRYRKECGIQTVMAPKDVEVQTKTESSTAGVQYLQYLAGLRGGPDAFNKIRFTQINISSDGQEKE